MVRFEDIKFDCRLYNGYKPCIYGNECAGCPYYEPHVPEEPGWVPTLEMAPLAQLPPRPRLMIIKTGALGDVLRTTALLHPLRRHLPDAQITWVTASAARPLLADNPFIDRLVAMEDATLASVAAEPYDALICLEKEGPQLELAGKVNAGHHAGYLPTPWNTAAIANEEARYMLLLGVSDELKFFHNTKSYPHIITEACGLEFRRDPYILELSAASRVRRDEIQRMIERGGAAGSAGYRP